MRATPLMYWKGVLVATLCSCSIAVAQSIPDSLNYQLQHTTNDSIKASILLQIGESMEISAPEKSMDYYHQALLLARKANNNECIFLALINTGNCNIELNKMDSAVAGFENALHIARLLKDSVKVGRAYGNLGNVYLHKNDRAKAMEYYLHAARIWENSSNLQYLPTLYSSINALLEEQKESSRAVEFANKAIAMATKLGDTIALVDGLVNLSVSYNHLQQYDSAYQLLTKALPLAKNNGDMYQLVTICNNMGDYFMEKADFSAALSKYGEMHRYAVQMGNKYYLSSATLALARVYQQLNHSDKALGYILQAEKLANAVGERAELKEIYKIRAQIEEKLGNNKLSAAYYSKTLALSDSLFEAATSEKVAEAEAKYQNERKQKEILQLQKDKEIQQLSLAQKNTFIYFLVSSTAILLLLIIIGYRSIRNRKQLTMQRDELQQQRIRALEKDRQLVAVDALLQGQEEERSRLAKDLHDGLGGLLSGVKFSLSNMKDNLLITPDNMAVFERSLDMLDTSIKELRRVAHNMMPEMLTRFGLDEALKEYCNSINSTNLLAVKYQSVGMTERIDKSAEIIIYRIIQELLNNTMKHAGATEAAVQLVKDEGRLNVIAEDNGRGFDTSLPAENKGAGLTSIQSRVDYLKGRLEINSAAGRGTLINIEFNL